MSTPYSVIYTKFLSKIADYDLPDMSDSELSDYCNNIMESAIVKIPKIEHDLSKRDVINPDLITEIEDAQEMSDESNNVEAPEINNEEIEQEVQTIYVFPFSKTLYGRSIFEVPGLDDAVENDTSFTIFILSELFIRLLTFTKGIAETQSCDLQSGLSFKATYDGAQTFAFTNVTPRSFEYTILYITYGTPNTNPSGDNNTESQAIQVDKDIIDQIISEDEISQEEVFTEDLSNVEIEIISCQMVVEWINEKLNNTQLINMFVGTKDESMSSQANHIKELINLKEKQRAVVSVMLRDEAYRKWVEESDV